MTSAATATELKAASMASPWPAIGVTWNPKITSNATANQTDPAPPMTLGPRRTVPPVAVAVATATATTVAVVGGVEGGSEQVDEG